MIVRRFYELTTWRVPGPNEPIPCPLLRRDDLAEARLGLLPRRREAVAWLKRHLA